MSELLSESVSELDESELWSSGESIVTPGKLPAVVCCLSCIIKKNNIGFNYNPITL